MQFLKSDESTKAEKQAALEAELSALDSHLSQNGPFLKGANISAGDLALAPKLYHLQIALRELKVREARQLVAALMSAGLPSFALHRGGVAGKPALWPVANRRAC